MGATESKPEAPRPSSPEEVVRFYGGLGFFWAVGIDDGTGYTWVPWPSDTQPEDGLHECPPAAVGTAFWKLARGLVGLKPFGLSNLKDRAAGDRSGGLIRIMAPHWSGPSASG